MKLLVLWLASALSIMAADTEAIALLAKAKTAFAANRERQGHWIWTTTATGFITDKKGVVVERIPSVTVESPIRSDGKRCNAVVAWGDGREPYLADADPEARCAVEQESLGAFRVDALFEVLSAKIVSRSPEAITLAIDTDKTTEAMDGALRRCMASLQAKVQIDAVTSFPKHIEIKAVGSGCEQVTPALDHYDNRTPAKATILFHKGTVREFDYALQRAKAGDSGNDYWVSVHRHAVNPLASGARRLGMWGRYFDLKSAGDRLIVLDEFTVASEIATESTLKFDTEVKKDK